MSTSDIHPNNNASSPEYNPVCLYLDASNLPLSLRKTTPTYQLVSKTKPHGNHQIITQFDWIPAFASLLQLNSSSFSKAIIVYDSSKFTSYNSQNKLPPNSHTVLSPPSISLQVTDTHIEADHVLVQQCTHTKPTLSLPSLHAPYIVDISLALQLFINHRDKSKSQHCQDTLPIYIVLTRKAGGSKSKHKLLLRKLNLNRPHEGAFCLTGLTHRLFQQSCHFIHQLHRSPGFNHIIDCQVRSRVGVRDVVVTDDLLLTTRLVEQHAIVLNYLQMQQLV